MSNPIKKPLSPISMVHFPLKSLIPESVLTLGRNAWRRCRVVRARGLWGCHASGPLLFPRRPYVLDRWDAGLVSIRTSAGCLLSFPCHSHGISMSFPCHFHVISHLWMRLFHALSTSERHRDQPGEAHFGGSISRGRSTGGLEAPCWLLDLGNRRNWSKHDTKNQEHGHVVLQGRCTGVILCNILCINVRI